MPDGWNSIKLGTRLANRAHLIDTSILTSGMVFLEAELDEDGLYTAVAQAAYKIPRLHEDVTFFHQLNWGVRITRTALATGTSSTRLLQ